MDDSPMPRPRPPHPPVPPYPPGPPRPPGPPPPTRGGAPTARLGPRLGFVVLAWLLGAGAAAGQAVLATPALVGVVMPEGGEPMAILEDPATRQQELYPLGATIGNVRLTRILRDRVVLTSGGSEVEVRLARPSSLPTASTARPSPLPVRQGRRIPAGRHLLNR